MTTPRRFLAAATALFLVALVTSSHLQGEPTGKGKLVAVAAAVPKPIPEPHRAKYFDCTGFPCCVPSPFIDMPVATTPAGSCWMKTFHSTTTAAFPEILTGRLKMHALHGHQ